MKAISPAACRADNIRDLIAATSPGGIERQEAAGQASFVQDTTLPKDCDRDMLALAGVKFGPDANDLFVTVQLPDGWKKQATEHSMWSYLLDEKGRKRGSIFYKAAFYDRRAHMQMIRRYNIDGHVSCDADGNDVEYGKNTHMKTVVVDGDTALRAIAVRKADDYAAGDMHEKQAEQWLDQNHPDWRNPLAYW